MAISRLSHCALLGSLVLCSIILEWLSTGYSFLLPALPTSLTANAPFWSANAYSLSSSATLIWFSRVAARWDSRRLMAISLLWLAVWSAAAALSPTSLWYSSARAMQGIGSAALISCQLNLLSRFSRSPEERLRSVAASCAAAAVGFVLSILVAALAPNIISWKWYFWTAALLAAILLTLFLFSVPTGLELPQGRITEGWPGAMLLTIGLLSLAYTLAVFPDSSWRSPQLLVPLIGCILTLSLAVLYECRWSKDPLIPSAFFRPKGVKPLLAVCTPFYGAFGIILFFYCDYTTKVLEIPRLYAALCWIPTLFTGPLLSFSVERLTRRFTALEIVGISSIGWITAPLIFAGVHTSGAGRWAVAIAGCICTSIGIDITYAYSRLYLFAAQDKEHHGLIGSVDAMISSVSGSLALAIANLVTQTFSQGPRLSFWIALGLSGLGLLAAMLSLRTPAGFSKASPERDVESSVEPSDGTDSTYTQSVRLDLVQILPNKGED